MKNDKQLVGAMCAGISVLAITSIAYAQSAPVVKPPVPKPAPVVQADSEEIVITGSRVITNGNNSPTPVTVVTTDELMEIHPGNVADALNDLPAFTQTRGQNTNPGTGGGGANNAAANNAINTMNMRALGSSRTLVLYNGKRLPPSSPEGWTDVNTIPQSLVKRVETVSGGASAVYGSDAVGGVVNFIADRNFNGIKGELRTGQSGFHDGKTAAGNLAFGTDMMDGRAHFMASYNTNHDAGIDSRLARQWGRNVYTLQGNGGQPGTFAGVLDPKIPYYIVTGARVNNFSFGGKVNAVSVTTSPLAAFGSGGIGANGAGTTLNTQFVGLGGTPVAFNHGLFGIANGLTTNSGVEIGGDGAFQNSTLKSALDVHQISGRFDFDFTSSLHGYLDVSGGKSYSSQATGYNTIGNNTGFDGQNAFLASAYRFNGKFTMGKYLTGPTRRGTESFSNHNYILAGLEGDLGDGYKWNTAFTTGATKVRTVWNNQFNNQKLTAALDAVLDSTGVVRCYAATQVATAAAYADCVPLNVFGVNSESAEAIRYVTTRTKDWLTTSMKGGSGQITGAPFHSWAGPINMALSGEWRKTTYKADSDSLPTDLANCTGLRNNSATTIAGSGTQCSAAGTTTLNQQTVATRSLVAQTVAESAIEADIPLLKDLSFVKSLNTNLAARYAKYNSTDAAASNRDFKSNTWKIGVVWDVTDALTVRASQSRDFRAPNLDELYRPLTLGQNVNGGALGNATIVAGATTVTGGNDKLKPETGDSTTFGMVYRVSPTLSFAMDVFNFKVKDAIYYLQTTNNASLANACIITPSNPYCSLLQFNSAGQITYLQTAYVNAGYVKTNGMDFEANWRTTLFDRPFSMRGLVTYQPHFTNELPGLFTLEEAGTAVASGQEAAGGKVRVNVTLNYRPTEQIGVTLQQRWRSELNRHDRPDFYTQASKVASVTYTNLNMTYTPRMETGDMNFFLNIQNLLNTEPPPSSAAGSAGLPGLFGGTAPGDDTVGRYLTAGVRFNF